MPLIYLFYLLFQGGVFDLCVTRNETIVSGGRHGHLHLWNMDLEKLQSICKVNRITLLVFPLRMLFITDNLHVLVLNLSYFNELIFRTLKR